MYQFYFGLRKAQTSLLFKVISIIEKLSRALTIQQSKTRQRASTDGHTQSPVHVLLDSNTQSSQQAVSYGPLPDITTDFLRFRERRKYCKHFWGRKDTSTQSITIASSLETVSSKRVATMVVALNGVADTSGDDARRLKQCREAGRPNFLM